jgi:electron-transferring-flavoprotein dehydrogenase
MKRVDVAVVGGGPAGTSAVWEAARHGADALLLEKGVPRADRDGLGPDSTDAAGMLDYWTDIMDIDPATLPDDVVLQELDAVEFIGPSETATMYSTGIESSYDKFGYTFQRARMDDFLRDQAEDAGATYEVGVSVRDVETDLDAEYRHTLALADGEDVAAKYVVLADGPQRQVTMGVLDDRLPAAKQASEVLSPPKANHIAYQEHRRFPADAFEADRLKFWWGWMPGETAYPWVFPNDDNVARVGLTMPIGMTLDDVEDPGSYRLLDADDDQLPKPPEYIDRLLEAVYGDEYDVDEAFPRVTDRGKSEGTETYPISSTRPIDSPVDAGIAVAGGAMGTTSAFHEGGYHVAVRSGKIAGELAATGELQRYNDAWKRAIGTELIRNVAFADLVADYQPADWDRTFSIARRMLGGEDDDGLLTRRLSAGPGAIKLLLQYKWRKRSLKKDGYVQITENDYVI